MNGFSYNNPIVPEGFKKVESALASWKLDEDGKPLGWNKRFSYRRL